MNKIKQNMNKEQQDKLWNELSEESKEKIKAEYLNNIQEAHNPENSDEIVNVLLGKNEMLIDLFGYHNLNPEPKIKEWKDVELSINEDYCKLDLALGSILPNYKDDKIRLKIKATFKIAKLIELGYGGMVSEEEWKNEDIRKFSIVRFQENLSYTEGRGAYEFVSFHTPEQREEFMSHESNRKLVEQYHLM